MEDREGREESEIDMAGGRPERDGWRERDKNKWREAGKRDRKSCRYKSQPSGHESKLFNATMTMRGGAKEGRSLCVRLHRPVSQ